MQMNNGQYGDYDHCISALRQLQKRVTVNLIYDPIKTLMKEGKPQPLQKDEENLAEDELEDSQMEDLAETSSAKNEALSPQIIQKKKSHHPAFLKNLAASPEKDMTAIEQ